MIDHGMSLINDTLHVNIPDDPKVNKIIYNGVEFVSGAQWITCSERLPETQDDVLLTEEIIMADKSKYMNVVYAYYNKRNKEWLTDIGDWAETVLYPVAWMPLPKPWKEEQDERR